MVESRLEIVIPQGVPRLNLTYWVLRSTGMEMPKELILRKEAHLSVWLERMLYSNFEDEISLRRGECENQYF